MQELSKLQDKVPAFASEKALSIVEKELGAPASQLFRSFDRRPIAAASLGQVYNLTGCPLRLRNRASVSFQTFRKAGALLARGQLPCPQLTY